jgi:hypothetical protein
VDPLDTQVAGDFWRRAKNMNRYKAYLIALAVVTIWGGFAYIYLGVEDGSSGLNLLGWIHAMYFLPGGLALQMIKESHSNADLPLMVGASWLAYSIVAVGIAHAWIAIHRRKESNQQSGRGSRH